MLYRRMGSTGNCPRGYSRPTLRRSLAGERLALLERRSRFSRGCAVPGNARGFNADTSIVRYAGKEDE